MLKRTIKYTNFNDEEKVMEAYFHLGKADITRIAANPEFLRVMEKASSEKDTKTMLEKIEELVRLSYGVRSEDGERFVKTREVQDAFIQSAAYEEFLADLVTGDGTNFTKFLQGVFPPKLMEQLRQRVKDGEMKDPFAELENPVSNTGVPLEPTYAEQAEAPRPAWLAENRVPSKAELMAMSNEEMVEAFRKYPGLLNG